jgi:pimeloyl-ACP methyl ester carboxylesterase
VLNLLRELRMFPHMLVGHSFGGKVVMSMAHQFGASLPRPVQVRGQSSPWSSCASAVCWLHSVLNGVVLLTIGGHAWLC